MESAPQSPRFYITTAIDYPNAAPHIGTALEKVGADVMARFRRMQGMDTLFSMGLDENSQHVLRAAEEANVSARAWVDRMDEVFQEAWASLNISYDRFIRTTEEVHIAASEELFRRSLERGDIYKGTYSGWYCPNCNTFYDDDDLVEERCPNHPTLTPEWLDEENYFFALSRYQEPLERHIADHPDFIVPTTRRNEVLGWLRDGLRDFSTSRLVRNLTGERWGITVPGDDDHVMYVWYDALTNYLTSSGFAHDDERYARYWPADVHVIGKDITRFHCLYWPAMLMSAGVPLPRQVVVHGWWNLEGKPFSKTTGNVLDPRDAVAEFGTDPVRYYLMREGSWFQDGNFARANLIQRYHAELANDLGNLLNRTVTMIGRYCDGRLPAGSASAAGERETAVQRAAETALRDATAALDGWEFGRALDAIWQLVRRGNQYIDESQPWRLARDPAQRAVLEAVLATSAESLRFQATLLGPFMPGTADRMLAQLGLDGIAPGAWRDLRWQPDGSGRPVPGGSPLFPRLSA